jgi:putative membrane protein
VHLTAIHSQREAGESVGVIRGQLARLVDFYRAQIELIWTWRRGRRQLLLRAAISFVVAFVSLAATAALLPGLAIDTPLALAAAVIVIGLLSALVRPILLALVAPISIILMLLTALVFQVFTIVVLAPIVPGVHVRGLGDAIIAALVFAVISSAFTWVLSLDSDDSYYSTLVRRLLSRRPDATHTSKAWAGHHPDRRSRHSVLTQQVNAGRVPVISRWLREDKMRLARGPRCCRARPAPARPGSCTATTTTSQRSAGGTRRPRPCSCPTGRRMLSNWSNDWQTQPGQPQTRPGQPQVRRPSWPTTARASATWSPAERSAAT